MTDLRQDLEALVARMRSAADKVTDCGMSQAAGALDACCIEIRSILTKHAGEARDYVMVPREPTEAMAETFRGDFPAGTYYTHTTLQCADFTSRYKAMIDAAMGVAMQPQPPQGGE